MVGDWSEASVIELQRARCLLVEDGNHGEYRPRQNEFGEGEWAFIRAADMENGRVLFDSAARINKAARDRIIKGIGAGGDVLLSHKGTVGKVAFVSLDAPPFVCSPQTTFWRALNLDYLDRRYLYYFLCSDDFQQQLEARKSETDMAPYVSLTAQRQLKVKMPPVEVQRAIARILGALDDKIELNRRMNHTLEAMALAIFKSWFVDFDPVIAKSESRHPYGMNAETAALFPSALQDSELGPIPKGWKVSTIGQEVKVVGGTTPSTREPRYWNGGTICWATPRDLSKLTDPILLDTERQITPEGLSQISSGLLPVGTVLLSSRAPIGYLAIAQIPVAINQGFIAMICNGTLSNHYVLHWTAENMDEILARSGGTTFGEISKSNFRPIPVIVPDQNVLQRYDAWVSKLHAKIVANLREIRTLAAIRDALLPKLLSGEIRVNQVAETQ